MKRDILLNNKFFLALWGAFHAALLVFFLITICFTNVEIDTDLFNMIPQAAHGEAAELADSRFTEFAGQRVTVLVANEDFAKARRKAALVYDALEGSPNFSSLTLYSDASALEGVADYMSRYKWSLLSDGDIALLDSPGGAEVFAQNALAAAYSPFSLLPLDDIDSDPFRLAEGAARRFAAQGAAGGIDIGVRDGVLAKQDGGTWYVMIRGALTARGAALASSDNGIAEIYSVCAPLEGDGTRFVYYGTPYYSHQSSNSAAREITWISAVSFAVVIAILLFVFRTPLPICFSVLSILLSIGSALAATLAVFHKVHILTFVFGTSLIGSCIDYSLHYFISWKASPRLKSGAEVRRFLFSGLVFSLISTEVCFFVLMFAPFGLLRQMSLFSLTGILSSFLTVAGLFPCVPIPREASRRIPLPHLPGLPGRGGRRILARALFAAIVLAAAVLGTANYDRLRVENDILGLIPRTGRLRENELEARRVLAYSPMSWFLIEADSEEALLEKEEAFCRELEELDGGEGRFLRTTAYIPSRAAQERSRRAVREHLLPLAESQLAALGASPGAAASLRADFAAGAGDFISPSSAPGAASAALSTMWLGEVDGHWYSLVIPILELDKTAYLELAARHDGVTYVNKFDGLNDSLNRLTSMMLWLFAGAYVLLLVVLRAFYSWRHTLRIVSVPLAVILATGAVFGVLGTHLEFFSITGMILVLGLGMDYIIYTTESEKRSGDDEAERLESFAVFLSFFTTVVSFGALAASSFMPVHLMGLAITCGLVTAYACARLLSRR